MTKRNRIIYWVSTLWLVSGMLSSGILQLFKAKMDGALSPPGVFGITHLGYPVYFLTILGIWKILGVAAILMQISFAEGMGLCGLFLCGDGSGIFSCCGRG